MPRKKKKPFKRLPNGFGTIRCLPGKRRAPYQVVSPARMVNGTEFAGEVLGYFPTWEEGYERLVLYRAAREWEQRKKKERLYTFAEVYEAFYRKKFELSLRKYSVSTQAVTQAAYRNCERLHQKVFAKITPEELQGNLDELAAPSEPGRRKLKHASLEHVVNLYHQMYRYAEDAGIAEKDRSRNVRISIPDDDEKGVPLTPAELAALWQHPDIPEIRAALILCYSGWRIAEFVRVEIDLDEMVFRGGLKTKAGKGRVVPILPAIWPLLRSYMDSPYDSAAEYRKRLYAALDALGMERHTPHDFRHTFSWLCDRYRVDGLAKRMMLGHALGGDVTDQVYGHRTLDELRQEIGKIQTDDISFGICN